MQIKPLQSAGKTIFENRVAFSPHFLWRGVFKIKGTWRAFRLLEIQKKPRTFRRGANPTNPMKNSHFLAPLLVLSGVMLSAGAPAWSAPAAKPKTSKTVPTWKPATKTQRAQAAASIRAQLDAFKRDDWDKAATFQSEGLRRNFVTIEQFRAVIETNYPQFASYKNIAFDEARALGDRVEIQVRLTGQDGVKLRAIYQMIKERGAYRVAGVRGGGLGGAKPENKPNPADYV